MFQWKFERNEENSVTSLTRENIILLAERVEMRKVPFMMFSNLSLKLRRVDDKNTTFQSSDEINPLSTSAIS